MEKLKKDGSFYKFNGIVECVRTKTQNKDIIEILNKLKTDNSQIAGRSIAEYSIAALDVLGVESYTGTSENILGLIKSKFSF